MLRCCLPEPHVSARRPHGQLLSAPQRELEGGFAPHSQDHLGIEAISDARRVGTKAAGNKREAHMKLPFENQDRTLRHSNWIALVADSRGSVTLEYTIVLALVGVTASTALVALGVGMVESFDFVRGLVLNPIP